MYSQSRVYSFKPLLLNPVVGDCARSSHDVQGKSGGMRAMLHLKAL